jgi:hypothetical protein
MILKLRGKNALRWTLAAGLLANGAAMLMAPSTWYETVPGLLCTGPLNTHFVRDIGCAYAVAGLSVGWRARRSLRGEGAAIAGATFLLLHALVHLAETIAGGHSWGRFLSDAPLVVLPACIALVLALPPRISLGTDTKGRNLP